MNLHFTFSHYMNPVLELSDCKSLVQGSCALVVDDPCTSGYLTAYIHNYTIIQQRTSTGWFGFRIGGKNTCCSTHCYTYQDSLLDFPNCFIT